MQGSAGAPARGSRSPETQSQLRKDPSGERDPGLRPGCPLPMGASRTPVGSCPRYGGSSQSLRGCQGGVGRRGPTAAPLRRGRPAGTKPGTPAPDRPETSWDRQRQESSSGPELPVLLFCLQCRSPHPELRIAQDPLDTYFGPWNPRPLDTTPTHPPTLLTLTLSSLPYQDGLGPWEWVHLVSSRPSRGPGEAPRVVQAHLCRTGQGTGRARPSRAAFSLSAVLSL